MTTRNKLAYRASLATRYSLAKLKFLHGVLPRGIRDQLPVAWNDKMFWTAFNSGGTKVYIDHYAALKEPDSYQPKVAVAEEYRLSEDEIRSFYEKGYIGPFTLMPPEEMAAVKDYLVSMASTESGIYSYKRGDFVVDGADQEQRNSNGKVMSNFEVALRKMQWRDRHLEDATLLGLFKHPAVTERCAQLLGPDLMLWRTQFFPKSPTNCGTPWHQATTYMLDNMREHVVMPPQEKMNELFQLTVWIALTDATKERGAMTVLPGTQHELYPVTGSGRYDTSKAEKETNRVGTVQINMDYEIDPEKIEYINMKAGQFFIFTERVIHGSVENKSQEWRWGVNGRIVRPDTQIYTDNMRKYGHAYKTQNVIKLKLDRWKAVMIRGEDRYGLNPLLEEEPAPAAAPAVR